MLDHVREQFKKRRVSYTAWPGVSGLGCWQSNRLAVQGLAGFQGIDRSKWELRSSPSFTRPNKGLVGTFLVFRKLDDLGVMPKSDFLVVQGLDGANDWPNTEFTVDQGMGDVQSR